MRGATILKLKNKILPTQIAGEGRGGGTALPSWARRSHPCCPCPPFLAVSLTLPPALSPLSPSPSPPCEQLLAAVVGGAVVVVAMVWGWWSSPSPPSPPPSPSSRCSPFPPRKQLLAAAVGGAVGRGRSSPLRRRSPPPLRRHSRPPLHRHRHSPPLPFVVVPSPSPSLPFASLRCGLPRATTQPSHEQGLVAVVGVAQGVPVVVVDSILVLLVKRIKK